MLEHDVIVVATNATYSDGCDYARQTAEILAKENASYVMLLGDPLPLSSAVLAGFTGAVFRARGVVYMRPLLIVPGNRHAAIKQLNYAINALFLRLYIALRHPRVEKIFWFFEPGNIPMIYPFFYGYKTVYDCVDNFRSFGPAWIRADRYLVPRVSVMACNSRFLADFYRRDRPDVSVVPSGFASGIFHSARPHGASSRKKPVIGYVGAVNDRLDFVFLYRLARTLPDMTFVFVGPVQYESRDGKTNVRKMVERLFALPNVAYWGEVPKKDIPSRICRFHIGLVPYDTQNGFNRYSFPMKALEYLYCGVPVVSSRIAALSALSPFVYTGTGVSYAVTAIRHFLSFPPSLAQKARMRRIAMDHAWERKVEAISRLVSALPGN